jgi:hypothetical protein
MYALKTYPGKYEGNNSPLLAEVVNRRVNDGFAETCGDVESVGFFAYVKGKRFHFILSEDSQGFVMVEPFSDHVQAAKEWDKIQVLVDTENEHF